MSLLHPGEFHLAFTGTEYGITSAQLESMRIWLSRLVRRPEVVVGHHGDCIGGDCDFHRLCHEFGIEVEVHPPNNPNKRAYVRDYRRRYDELAYLQRNRALVTASRQLLALPYESEEIRRSGVWATVREAAERQHKDVLIILPSGKHSSFGEMRWPGKHCPAV